METMNIAIPNDLREYVQKQIRRGAYSSASEYVRELIRNDQRQRARKYLEAEVLQGLRSGESEPMTPEEWAEIRAEVTSGHKKKTKKT